MVPPSLLLIVRFSLKLFNFHIHHKFYYSSRPLDFKSCCWPLWDETFFIYYEFLSLSSFIFFIETSRAKMNLILLNNRFSLQIRRYFGILYTTTYISTFVSHTKLDGILITSYMLIEPLCYGQLRAPEVNNSSTFNMLIKACTRIFELSYII